MGMDLNFGVLQSGKAALFCQMWTAPSLLFVTWCPRGGLSHKEWNGNSTMIIITYHHNRLEEPKSQSIQSQFTAVTSSFGKKISHWPTGRGHHTTAWVDVFMIARYCKVSLSLCCNRFALASTVPHNWSQRNNTCFDHLLFKYHSNTGLLVASTVPAQGPNISGRGVSQCFWTVNLIHVIVTAFKCKP